ncbi:hypothetical protein P3T73_07845 [Kiritimatiellota bacterium B12222]|nr:hypothetical protein P3T73_07845 [Kiritimatiellota bacterium B12222]
MTDPSENSQEEKPTTSYRTCTACGCGIHQSRDCCPECGAFPDEHHIPSPDKATNLTMTTVIILILGLALFTLSRDREAAALRESETFSRLSNDREVNNFTTPVALPTPLPQPTAIPVVPTAQPRPQPQATATPQPQAQPQATAIPPTPTPVPKPTRPSTLDLKDQYAAKYRNQLNEKLPMAQVGDSIRLTLRDNRTIDGVITQFEQNRLSLQATNGILWISYRQLARKSRMQVDKSERDTWVEEKALEEVLKGLQH